MTNEHIINWLHFDVRKIPWLRHPVHVDEDWHDELDELQVAVNEAALHIPPMQVKFEAEKVHEYPVRHPGSAWIWPSQMRFEVFNLILFKYKFGIRWLISKQLNLPEQTQHLLF